MDIENLKLEDLVMTCERCRGTGQVTERPPRDSSSVGRHLVSQSGPCGECEGGQIFTPLGRTLRDFVKKVAR